MPGQGTGQGTDHRAPVGIHRGDDLVAHRMRFAGDRQPGTVEAVSSLTVQSGRFSNARIIGGGNICAAPTTSAMRTGSVHAFRARSARHTGAANDSVTGPAIAITDNPTIHFAHRPNPGQRAGRERLVGRIDIGQAEGFFPRMASRCRDTATTHGRA